MSAEAEKLYCDCRDWEPCACGQQPPYHCMWCCRELRPAQVAEAKSRGYYSEKNPECC